MLRWSGNLLVVLAALLPRRAAAEDPCKDWRGRLELNPNCLATVNLAVCLMRAEK